MSQKSFCFRCPACKNEYTIQENQQICQSIKEFEVSQEILMAKLAESEERIDGLISQITAVRQTARGIRAMLQKRGTRSAKK